MYFKFHENRSRGLGTVGWKIALCHWQGPWLIQQLVLPYKPWHKQNSKKYRAYYNTNKKQTCTTSNTSILIQFKRNSTIKQLTYKHNSKCLRIVARFVALNRNKNGLLRIHYTGCGKKVTPKIFFSFLSNRLEFQSKILQIYLVILYAHKSLIII